MSEGHNHFYITPDILPKPDDTDTEWIQRVTMLSEMGEDVMRTIYTYLRINAPILVTEDQLLYHLIAGVGLVLRGIHITGSTQLEKVGERPLDAEEEQMRLIRDQLAAPNCPADIRDALLTILQHNLEATRERVKQPPVEDAEWPSDGIVIGGE